MSELNERLRNLITITQQGAVLPTALGNNKEFRSPDFPSTPTFWKKSHRVGNPVTKTVWVLTVASLGLSFST